MGGYRSASKNILILQGRWFIIQSQTIGYLIGGIIPAVLLGIYSVLQKASAKQGISPGAFLVLMGIQIVIIGLAYCYFYKDNALTFQSGLLASGAGIFWAFATCLISIALSKYGMPVSNLVPLFNMNTLVAVCLGLFIFAEWNIVNPVKLLTATVLIIIGGILAT